MPVIAIVLLSSCLLFANAVRNRFGKIAPVVLFVAMCLICEIFCFNFESFRSATYPPIESFTVECSPRVTNLGDSYEFRSSSDYITLSGFSAPVKNIHIATNTTSHVVRFFATDDANLNRYHAGDRTISRFSGQTSYIKTNFTGSAQEIRIYIPDISNRIITLSDIRVNCQRPVFFSILRPLIAFLFLVFIYYIIIRRDLWNKEFDPDDPSQSNTTMAVACVLAVIFLATPFLNPAFISPPWPHHNQYNDLAEAFLDGQLHLNKEVPDILAEMENPYDRNERLRLFKLEKITEPWDTAYYNGKFYVYFGVLPVFLFYLPAQLIGFDFPNFLAIVIFSWVLIAGVFLFYSKMIKMYFPKVPYLLYLVLSTLTAACSGVFYLIKRPDFYSVPIMGALAFTVMGLYFWLSSIENERISRGKMLAGSIFMASVIALRPNLVFFSCAAFVIFWHSVFTDRELLSIKSRLSDDKYRGLINTLIFCAPYIIIGVLVMVYNMARFSSPFDFGAAYNLTTSDMTLRGFNLDRFGLGVFEYLFRPPTIQGTFPYLVSSMPETAYIGFTSREGMFGGIFAVCPVLWALLALHKVKKERPFPLVVFLTVTSFIVCLLDIQAGGILPRYTSDFALFFVMAAAITLFMLYKSHQGFVKSFTAWALLATIVYDLLLIIAGGTSTLQSLYKPTYIYLFSELAFYL